MKIVIKIPKEFEDDFKKDRFEDCFARVASDIGSFGSICAGRYEKETITMLREAIKKGTPLPEHHGRLIDKDKMIADLLTVDPRYKKEIDWCVRITDAQLTIIEGSESE